MNPNYVYLSTVKRMAPIEKSGEILKFDWRHKEIHERTPIYPSDPEIKDKNPRGGTRGGRGITKFNDQIVVADYHTVHVYDSNLNELNKLSKNVFSNIHEITSDEQKIYVTSTKIDTLVEVSLKGKLINFWCGRDDMLVQQKTNTTPLNIHPEKDYRLESLGVPLVEKDSKHLHLNSVLVNKNGELFVTMNSLGAIIKLNPTKIVYYNPELKGLHNIIEMPNKDKVVCDTQNRRLIVFDENFSIKNKIEINRFDNIKKYLFISKTIRNLYPVFKFKTMHSMPFFLRGLTPVSNNKVLVGLSPLGVLEIDINKNELVDYHFFELNPIYLVHGLYADYFEDS